MSIFFLFRWSLFFGLWFIYFVVLKEYFSIIWIAKGWKFICDEFKLNIVAKWKIVHNTIVLPTNQDFCSRTVRLICCCHLYIFLMCNFFFRGYLIKLNSEQKAAKKTKENNSVFLFVIFFTTNSNKKNKIIKKTI